MDAGLPSVGTRVDAVLGDGRSMVGVVQNASPTAVWFKTEDRISDGTGLRLQWAEGGGAREAPVQVYPSVRRSVVFARVVDSEPVERRAVPRVRPAVTTLVRAEPIIRPDGMTDPSLNGTIVDLSTAAVAFTSERRLPDGTAVTIGFRSRQGRAIGSDVSGRIIRFEHRDPRFLVVVAFEDGPRTRSTLDEVLAACRAPGA
jgi:hypothetical protein